MAWVSVKVKAGDAEFEANVSSTSSVPLFSVPAVSGISSGDVFEANSKQYTAVHVVDVANRGETLLVEAKESKNDKSTKRRAGGDSGGDAVQDPSDD